MWALTSVSSADDDRLDARCLGLVASVLWVCALLTVIPNSTRIIHTEMACIVRACCVNLFLGNGCAGITMCFPREVCDAIVVLLCTMLRWFSFPKHMTLTGTVERFRQVGFACGLCLLFKSQSNGYGVVSSACCALMYICECVPY